MVRQTDHWKHMGNCSIPAEISGWGIWTWDPTQHPATVIFFWGPNHPHHFFSMQGVWSITTTTKESSGWHHSIIQHWVWLNGYIYFTVCTFTSMHPPKCMTTYDLEGCNTISIINKYVAALASATLTVALPASLAPVTWVWCCMGAERYINIAACCQYVLTESYISGKRIRRTHGRTDSGVVNLWV